MIYNQSLGLTMADIERFQQERLTPFLEEPFKWRSEYLPLLIGFGGVMAVFLVLKIKKKKTKRTKK